MEWPWNWNKKQQNNLNDHLPLNENEFLSNIIQFFNSQVQINSEFNGDQFVLNGYGGNGDLFSIINYTITTASNVPFVAEIKQPDGTWKIDPKSELIAVINNPNHTSGYSLMIEELLGWKMIDGTGYMYAPRIREGINKGKTKELWVMPSNGMRVIGGGITQIIKGYTYDQWEDLIPPENVMMIRYFNPLGTLSGDKRSIFTGMSPLKAMELIIKKSNTGAVAEISSYVNGGMNGFISRDGKDADFTPEQAEGLERRYKQASGGAANNKKLVFTPANVKFNKTGESPADLKIVDSNLGAKRTMAAGFKFPTQLINDPDGSTFNNQAEAHKSLYTNVIIPEMRSLGESFVRWLGKSYYPNDEIRIVPNTTDIEVLQANKKEQAEWLDKAWWIKGNQKQVIMGFEADSELDKYFIPTNLIELDDIDNLTEEDLRARIEAANQNGST